MKVKLEDTQYSFRDNFSITAKVLEQVNMDAEVDYFLVKLGWDAAIRYMLDLEQEVREALEDV